MRNSYFKEYDNPKPIQFNTNKIGGSILDILNLVKDNKDVSINTGKSVYHAGSNIYAASKKTYRL